MYIRSDINAGCALRYENIPATESLEQPHSPPAPRITCRKQRHLRQLDTRNITIQNGWLTHPERKNPGHLPHKKIRGNCIFISIPNLDNGRSAPSFFNPFFFSQSYRKSRLDFDSVTMAPKSKKSGDNINSRLALVMKSGKGAFSPLRVLLRLETYMGHRVEGF